MPQLLELHPRAHVPGGPNGAYGCCTHRVSDRPSLKCSVTFRLQVEPGVLPTCRTLGVRQFLTRPYIPRINGKPDRLAYGRGRRYPEALGGHQPMLADGGTHFNLRPRLADDDPMLRRLRHVWVRQVRRPAQQLRSHSVAGQRLGRTRLAPCLAVRRNRGCARCNGTP